MNTLEFFHSVLIFECLFCSFVGIFNRVVKIQNLCVHSQSHPTYESNSVWGREERGHPLLLD